MVSLDRYPRTFGSLHFHLPFGRTRQGDTLVEGEVCIANIGPRERRMRLDFGFRAVAIGLVAAALLVAFHVPALWRLPLFLVFATGTTSIFQWREKT